MKTKTKIWHLVLISIFALVTCATSSCGGDEDDPIVPPPSENNNGDVSVTIDTGGSSGSGSSTSPIVVDKGKELDMTLSQKSTYTDPDGSVITREPKANISLKAKLDTLYAKDIKTLTSVNGSPKVETSSSGTAPLRNVTLQTFTVGGQEITFDLAYEIYKIVNSANQTIEMPYIKLNPAQYGTASSVEDKNGQTRAKACVTGITLTPLHQTRSVTVTDSMAYNVSVSFNLDMESVNTRDENKQNLSFTVNYVAIVETSTEYPDPETTFSYNFNILSGTNDRVSPFTLNKGETLNLEWKQAVKYTYFSKTDMAMKTFNFEPIASVKLSAEADTLWSDNAEDFKKLTAGEPVVSVVAGETEKNTTSQVFEIGGQKVSAEWVYDICRAKTPEGEDLALPYLELGELNLESVDVTKKGEADAVEEISGKTAEVYEITAKFSQNLTSKQAKEEVKQTLEYVVKYIGAVEVKLESVAYRKGYKWHPAHDNIPLAAQLIVYRDRKYSNGKVFTDEYQSNLMAVGWLISPEIPRGGDFTIDQEGTLLNGDKVFYHKQDKNYTDYGGVITCKTRVPDIANFKPNLVCNDFPMGVAGENREEYYSFEWDKYFSPDNPIAGWYAKTIERRQIIDFEPKNAANFLRRYNISVMFPDRFCYIDGKLIDFLDKCMTYEFNDDYYPEEIITTPEGYPARVFKLECNAKYLEKDFYFAVIDTIYQTTPIDNAKLPKKH